MGFLKRVYSIYGLIVFALVFLALLPLFVIAIEVPGLKKQGRKLNWIWSRTFFFLMGIRVVVENKHLVEKDRAYIFVSNHFSFFDIPVLGLIPNEKVYIGKSSLSKLPLFGYMFRNLHISVNRSSLKSRGETVQRIKQILSEGSSVVIFPEGGIVSTDPPAMGRFKDSAFKVAIEKQIPIIPVTLSFNHLILPDDGKLLVNHGQIKVVVHPPVHVNNQDPKAFSLIRDRCFELIQNQLWMDNGIQKQINNED